MNAADVTTHLLELERPAIRCDRATIRSMLLRVEEGVLQLERLTIDTLKENAELRQRLERYENHPIAGQLSRRLSASSD